VDNKGTQFFRADLNVVAAFMTLVKNLSDESYRTAFKAGADMDPPIPPELAERPEFVAELRGMSLEELRWLAGLPSTLKSAELFDRYNPRLYYL
jgi:hypothetical protein